MSGGLVRKSVVDPTRPSEARVHDLLQGGKNNFAADRDLADRLLSEVPRLRATVRVHNQFRRRAVRHLARHGIRQYLDLGCGLPNDPAIHDIARQYLPDARVVYVDNDPMAVMHCQALTANGPGLDALEADLRSPDTVLDEPAVWRLIDFDQPVGVLMFGVLHTIPDPFVAAEVVRGFVARMAPGSYLAVSQLSTRTDPRVSRALTSVTEAAGGTVPALRSDSDLIALFDGFGLAKPGVVDIRDWRTGIAPRPALSLAMSCGVGRKR